MCQIVNNPIVDSAAIVIVYENVASIATGA